LKEDKLVKLTRIGQAAAVLSIAALGLTACGGSNNPGTSSSSGAAGSSDAAGASESGAAQVTGTLTGSGASSQQSAMAAWAEGADGIKSVQPDLKVQYSPDGSGAGVKKLIAGQVQFAGSDAALDADEQKQVQTFCGPEGAMNIPVYIAPIAISFKLDGVDSLNLDASTVAKIFTKKITKWNDPAIAALNDGVSLPDKAITVIHRSDESGTTENFAEYLHTAAPEDWTYEPAKAWPSDIQAESAAKTSGVVGLASTTDGAITYADLAAATELSHVSIKVGDEFVAPTEEAASKIVEASKRVESTNANDMAVAIDYANAPAGSYPVTMVSYQIFCQTYKDQNTVDMVKAWGTFVSSQAGQKAAQDEVGSAPLAASISDEAAKAIATITVAK
jgi:phosphate transport system substrate-binding protein